MGVGGFASYWVQGFALAHLGSGFLFRSSGLKGNVTHLYRGPPSGLVFGLRSEMGNCRRRISFSPVQWMFPSEVRSLSFDRCPMAALEPQLVPYRLSKLSDSSFGTIMWVCITSDPSFSLSPSSQASWSACLQNLKGARQPVDKLHARIAQIGFTPSNSEPSEFR